MSAYILGKRRLVAGVGVFGLLAWSGMANANQLYFGMPIEHHDQARPIRCSYTVRRGSPGSITSPNGFSSPFTVGATDVTSVVIPSSDDLTTSGLVTNNGFVVATDKSKRQCRRLLSEPGNRHHRYHLLV